MSELALEAPKPMKLITAADISFGLAKRYCAPEWAIFFNVANGTGMRGSRYADAVAMSLYPSRGLEIHGFETKISKSDYRREAADPAKAETIAAYCDRWWVVTPPNLLDTENLPPNWGWLAYDGRAFYTKHKAEKLSPKPLDRDFVAALLRRAHEGQEARVKAQIEKQTTGLREAVQAQVDSRLKESTRSHLKLQEQVKAFEAASGVSIGGWQRGDIGRAVALIEATGASSLYDSIQGMPDNLRRIAANIEKLYSDAGVPLTAHEGK